MKSAPVIRCVSHKLTQEPPHQQRRPDLCFLSGLLEISTLTLERPVLAAWAKVEIEAEGKQPVGPLEISTATLVGDLSRQRTLKPVRPKEIGQWTCERR